MSLNVIGKISSRCCHFGMNLLQDSNCVAVDTIVNTYTHHGPEAVALEILKNWLRKGGLTCTYQHLMDCLRESGLGALADEIAGELMRRGRSS